MRTTLKTFELLLAFALLSCPACLTSSHSQPPGLDEREIAKSVAVRSWLVQAEAGPAAGCVVRLETADEPDRYLYVVRNLFSQDLGLIDKLGRAYRYRPHRDEAELLGSATVAEGASRILELQEPAELIEIPLGDLERRLAQEQRRHLDSRRRDRRASSPSR